jgi:hypothetical protein
MAFQIKNYEPNALYFDLHFDKVKTEFLSTFKDIKDLGDLVIIGNNDYLFYVDNFGDVKLVYKEQALEEDTNKEIIEKIEGSFKNVNKNFFFIKK